MRRFLILAAGASALVSPALAEYTVKGGVECPAIVTEDADEHYREYNKWWLLGYVTARNYAIDQAGTDSNVGRGIEADDLYAMALEWCRQHPNNDWDDAAIQLFEQLSGAAAGDGAAEQGGGFPQPGGSGDSGGSTGGFPQPGSADGFPQPGGGGELQQQNGSGGGLGSVPPPKKD